MKKLNIKHLDFKTIESYYKEGYNYILDLNHDRLYMITKDHYFIDIKIKNSNKYSIISTDCSKGYLLFQEKDLVNIESIKLIKDII